MKKYIVSIGLDDFDIPVTAKNKVEAKKKALEKLSKRKIISLLLWRYENGRRVKDISAEEV